MKTRYFKNGILTLAAALCCAASVISCADDIEVGKRIDEGSYDGIYENNVVLRDAATVQPAAIAELYGDAFEGALKLSVTKPVGEGFAAQAAFDASYLETYNKEHGTDYALYPASLVTFENEGRFVFAKNAVETTLGMKITAAKELEANKTYVVPVAVTTTDKSVTVKGDAGHCVYLVRDMRNLPTCDKGEDLPKGFLFFEVNDVNPLNTLAFELEDGRLLWDVIVLFAANINYDSDNQRCYVKCNPNVQFLLDNNETYLQPLRKRGVKVLLGILGNHDQAGVAQLSEIGARDFAAEIAAYCEAYNLDGVNYDDEYSLSPDMSNPLFATPGGSAAGRLCYETKKAMPDKLVTTFSYSYMSVGAMPENIDGADIDEWIDIAVANYGSVVNPKGKMTRKKCSGLSMEFNGWFTHLDADYARSLADEGYGWFMGFAPHPVRYDNIFRGLKGGPLELYGSDLKDPTFFYKKDDPKCYVYPDDLD